MANVNSYYTPTGVATYTQGGVSVAIAGQVKSFTDWAALLYPQEASRLVSDIDTNPTWWTEVPAPSSGGDGLVLVSPADTTPKTLSEAIIDGTGLAWTIVNPGANETFRGDATGTGSGTTLNHYQNTAGSLVIPSLGTWTDITFPTAVTVSSAITKLAGDAEFEVNDTGTYVVMAQVTVESGDAMVRKHIRLMVDTGGGYAQTGSTFFSSNDSSFNDENTTRLFLPLVASANDTFKVQVRTDGGTTAGVLHADGCCLTILRFDPATAGTDSTAIHDDTAGEIAAITLKATPVSADELIIEDSAAGYVKKSITAGTLPVSAPTQTALDAKVGFTQATVSTTDATVTTIATIAVPATTTLHIEATVAARRTGGSSGTAEDGAGYKVLAAYKNVAGTATLIGSGVVTTVGEDQAGWDVTLSASGGNALIRVTGAVDNAVNWVCRYTTTSVS